jgi:sirohydrochlorin ferrochelatase
VILVGHGQPSAPQEGEQQIADLAAQVAQHMPGQRVEGTTLAVPGRLEDLVTQADQVVILPMFMTDGYFTTVALPKRVGAAQARILSAFGMDPRLISFTRNWLLTELAGRGWMLEETVLFLAAHGSARGPKPAIATQGFADALGQQMSFAEIRCGYVEQDPRLEDAAANLPQQSFCLPFFAFRRGHVIEDIPEALETTEFPGALLDPYGSHPDLPRYLADVLKTA